MAEVTKGKDLIDKVNIRTLVEFLEYEEALTNDPGTKNRITLLLLKLGIWEK